MSINGTEVDNPQISNEQEFTTPNDVSKEFLRQYYKVKKTAPHYLHRFYVNDSAYCDDQDSEYKGIAIHAYLKEQDIKSCLTEITFLDTQEGINNSIVITVLGRSSTDNVTWRAFAEHFTLRNIPPNQYYIKNHVVKSVTKEDDMFKQSPIKDPPKFFCDDLSGQQGDGYVVETKGFDSLPISLVYNLKQNKSFQQQCGHGSINQHQHENGNSYPTVSVLEHIINNEEVKEASSVYSEPESSVLASGEEKSEIDQKDQDEAIDVNSDMSEETEHESRNFLEPPPKEEISKRELSNKMKVLSINNKEEEAYKSSQEKKFIEKEEVKNKTQEDLSSIKKNEDAGIVEKKKVVGKDEHIKPTTNQPYHEAIVRQSNGHIARNLSTSPDDFPELGETINLKKPKTRFKTNKLVNTKQAKKGNKSEESKNESKNEQEEKVEKMTEEPSQMQRRGGENERAERRERPMGNNDGGERRMNSREIELKSQHEYGDTQLLYDLPDSFQVFVGNLPNTVQIQELSEILSEFGDIAAIKIQPPGLDRYGNSRSSFPFCAFVAFKEEKSAKNILLNKEHINLKLPSGMTRRINIEEKISKAKDKPYGKKVFYNNTLRPTGNNSHNSNNTNNNGGGNNNNNNKRY